MGSTRKMEMGATAMFIKYSKRCTSVRISGLELHKSTRTNPPNAPPCSKRGEGAHGAVVFMETHKKRQNDKQPWTRTRASNF